MRRVGRCWRSASAVARRRPDRIGVARAGAPPPSAHAAGWSATPSARVRKVRVSGLLLQATLEPAGPAQRAGNVEGQRMFAWRHDVTAGGTGPAWRHQDFRGRRSSGQEVGSAGRRSTRINARRKHGGPDFDESERSIPPGPSWVYRPGTARLESDRTRPSMPSSLLELVGRGSGSVKSGPAWALAADGCGSGSAAGCRLVRAAVAAVRSEQVAAVLQRKCAQRIEPAGLSAHRTAIGWMGLNIILAPPEWSAGTALFGSATAGARWGRLCGRSAGVDPRVFFTG